MSCNHNHTKENPETFYFNGQAEDNCAACQAFGRQHEDQVLLAEFMYSDGHEGVIALKDGRFYSVHCSYITECTSYERLEFHHAAVIILDLVHKYTANVWPDRIAQWPALQTAIELYRYPVCAADLAKHATVIVTLSCPDSGNVISLSLSEWAALTHGGYYALPGQYTLDAECSGELFNRHRKIGLLRHPPHDWWTPVIHQAHQILIYLFIKARLVQMLLTFVNSTVKPASLLMTPVFCLQPHAIARSPISMAIRASCSIAAIRLKI